MNNLKENESLILYKVEKEEILLRELLKDELEFSGRLFKRLLKNKLILVNNKFPKSNEKIFKGDLIKIFLEDEKEDIVPQDIKIDIIYEDYDILVINKVPGIVVHPTKSHDNGTIANGVANYFKKKGIQKKVRFVNRLDMDTSGILVIAKNSFGHQQMAYQMSNNIISKKYITIVEGVIENDEGIIDANIGKDDKNSILNIVRKDGKKAITKYKVIDRFKNATAVEVELLTGKTHQIRVHFKHIGHPIVGDSLYNKKSPLIGRQALHSWKLSFDIPRKKEKAMVIAQLPEDINRLINKL
ncbi:RluA family pseudouridine synthase [Clostridiisalibacter paucivorans]|uniref:RluA family pseudouridine synthase n=1 Tax=Clostridiisalibacter paucivorans TaxID=408753 RepID=UPI00047E25D2|nr:RluA family pseudouridine synthase [Clostridiisalibacter paucivorans]